MSDPTTVLGVSLTDDKSGGKDNKDPLDVDAFIAANIGEGKRFATPEEALREVVKGKLHADTFIETLKLEVEGERKDKAELEARLAEAKKLDDLMAALTNEGGERTSALPPAEKNNSAQIDLDQVTSIVKNVLQAEKDAAKSVMQEADKAANRDKAFELLAKPASEGGFGSMENAKLAIREYVGKDSAKAEIIDRIGSHTPEAVAEFLKIQLKNTNKLDGIGESSVVVPEATRRHEGMLTWAKCKEVRKNDPTLYKSPKFQMQIHEAAAANPDFWK